MCRNANLSVENIYCFVRVLVFERKRNTVMTMYDNKNNRMYYIGCLADLNEDNESTPENHCESRWLCATVVRFLYCKQ